MLSRGGIIVKCSSKRKGGDDDIVFVFDEEEGYDDDDDDDVDDDEENKPNKKIKKPLYFPTPPYFGTADYEWSKIETPTYVAQVDHIPPIKLEVGDHLDVVSLLSNGGRSARDFLLNPAALPVPLDSLVGKCLIIVCFFVPVLAAWHEARLSNALIAAYSQLSSQDKNFEMVIVTKVRTSLFTSVKRQKAAFTRFSSCFPCLSIPFSDVESRDFACKSLGLPTHYEQLSAVILDPQHKVLSTNPWFLTHFGASAFPFTPTHLAKLDREDEVMRCRLDPIYRELNQAELSKSDIDQVIIGGPVSLEELLGCDTLLTKCTGDTDHVIDKISVTDLGKQECVGLYLCYGGSFMPELACYHQECLAKGLVFEIVVVFLPVLASDDTSFFQAIQPVLRKLKVSSWWKLPFVDEVSRRLWRLCDSVPDDSLIILTNDGKVGELNGKGTLIRSYPHPFTRKYSVDATFSRLRAQTLDSLIGDSCCDLLCGNGMKIAVSELKGRNILLYLDSAANISERPRYSRYKKMVEYYEIILHNHNGCEVIFVPCGETPSRGVLPSMPWATFIDSATAHDLIKQLRSWVGGYYPALIAIGTDGLIHSRLGFDRLNPFGKVPLFKDTLREEIVNNLEQKLKGAY